MKKNTVLTALALVLVLAAAWFGYKKLSEKLC